MQLGLRCGRQLLRTRLRPRPPTFPRVPIPVRFAHKRPTVDNPDEQRKADIPDERKADIPDEDEPKIPEMFAPYLRLPESIEELEQMEGPLTEEQINDPDAVPISIYEEDPTSPTGERLIQHLRTPEERRKHNEIHKMLMEAETNPDYDDRKLNHHLIDELMKEPSLADLMDDLKDIKENFILSKEQEEKMLAEDYEKEKKFGEQIESMGKQIESAFQLSSHESVQDLINDPDFAYARAELEELQNALPDIDGEDSPEYQAALDKVLKKLGQDSNLGDKTAASEAEHGELIKAMEAELEEDTKMLSEMKELMTGMAKVDEMFSKLEAEMEKVLNEDLEDDEDVDEEEVRGQEMSLAELGEEIERLVEEYPEGGVRNFEGEEDGDDEPIDPELEAKVNKIMEDPKLMEKLMYIQKVIIEEQEKKAALEVPAELAPDPTKLEPHRITSIKQRMQIVRNDPEHLAALQALRVKLLPPFNVSPALRIFNEAIEYAYIGANDDIRRILWRAYSKARTLPTFLQNLSDDAWDILYYSQAVKWRGNQNRETHLRLLLQDLRSVGKDGPPTHPSTLAEAQQQ